MFKQSSSTMFDDKFVIWGKQLARHYSIWIYCLVISIKYLDGYKHM
jgi:hypothetical protein